MIAHTGTVLCVFCLCVLDTANGQIERSNIIREVDALQSLGIDWGLSKKNKRTRWHRSDRWDDPGAVMYSKLYLKRGIAGVILDQQHHVVELNLTTNNLQGSLSPSVCALRRLEVLDLSHNQLIKQLPPCLGRLRRLRTIALNDNSFVGEIPPQWQKLSRLTELSLQGNYLQGDLLPLSKLNNLRTLRLQNNLFGGGIFNRVSGNRCCSTNAQLRGQLCVVCNNCLY